MAKTLQQITKLPYVMFANQENGRIYIKLWGKCGNFPGERNTKIYIEGDKLNVREGNGLTSAEWFVNLRILKAAMA